MADGGALWVFIGASVALLLLPGPAVLYIVARGVDQGRGAALVSVLGIHLGTLVHVVAVSLGLSAILVASATAFSLIKFGGAAYLVWLGIGRLRSGDVRLSSHVQDVVPLPKVFWQGAIVNVLNPKTAIFFLAFLPQFVEEGGWPIVLQLGLLGLLFLAIGVVTDSVYALASGGIGSILRRRPAIARRSKWFTGSSYIALGVGTAFTGTK